MKEETTSRLEQSLRELNNNDDATKFIGDHKGTEYSSFSDYYQKYIGSSGKEMSEIVSDAGFGEYAYQIMRGIKKPTNRDRVIALCIAAGMSVKETDRALRLADHYPLSPKDERDVRIVVCINNGMTRVMDVDLELDRFGIEPLCGD